MRAFQKLIEILLNYFSDEKLIEHLGKLKKQIGSILILESAIDGISGIGIVKDNKKILSISVVFNSTISFDELKNLFLEYSISYNHYDEKTILSFQLDNKLIVLAKKDGFFDENEINKQFFSEFEFTFK